MHFGSQKAARNLGPPSRGARPDAADDPVMVPARPGFEMHFLGQHQTPVVLVRVRKGFSFFSLKKLCWETGAAALHLCRGCHGLEKILARWRPKHRLQGEPWRPGSGIRWQEIHVQIREDGR